MNLEEIKDHILHVKKLTIKEAAIQMGVSRVHLTNVLNGQSPLGPKTEKKLTDWLKGTFLLHQVKEKVNQ